MGSKIIMAYFEENGFSVIKIYNLRHSFIHSINIFFTTIPVPGILGVADPDINNTNSLVA